MTSEAEVRELLARVQRLEDTLEIQKLQSKYAHYLFTQQFERVFGFGGLLHRPGIFVGKARPKPADAHGLLPPRCLPVRPHRAAA